MACATASLGDSSHHRSDGQRHRRFALPRVVGCRVLLGGLDGRSGGYDTHMLLWVALALVAWIVLSIPVALVVGRMFAAGHVEPTGPGRAPGGAERVAYLSHVESRRSAASRWPHEA